MGIIARQSIKGTVVNYVGVGIGALTTFFILTRVLTAEEIGLTRVLVDASTLLASLAQLGATSSAIRFYPYFKDSEKKDHGFFFWSVIIPLVGFLIYGLLFWFLRGTVNGLFAEKSALFVNYYNFVFPLGFFLLYLSTFETNANLLMRIAVPKFVREVLVRLLNLGAYLLYAFKVVDFNGFIIVFCAGYGLATCVNIFYLFSLKKVSFKPDIKHITPALRKDFLLYTLFLITAALTGSITPFINSFFISIKMGLTYTGIFAIATYIATMIEIPYRSLGAISRPVIAQSMKDKDIKETAKLAKKVSLHQFMAGSFILFFIWANINLIFNILPNGEQYESAKSVILILGLTRLFYSTLAVCGSVIGYSKYYYFSLIFTLVLTAVAIYLNNLLIPIWGMNGAVLASFFAYVVQYSMLVLLLAWKVKITPFSFNQLKCLIIVVLLFALDFLWSKTLTPLFLGISNVEMVGVVIDAVLKSCIFGIMGLASLYWWNVSDEINRFISKHIIHLRAH